MAIKLGVKKIIAIDISLFKKTMPYDHKSVDLVIIKLNNRLGSPLVFDGIIAKKNMKYGYNDTMKKIKKLFGKRYTFKNLDANNYQYLSNEQEFIKILERLGKTYQLDDTQIYDLPNYN